MTLPQTLLETLLISLGRSAPNMCSNSLDNISPTFRAFFFYACRHYLLRSLYHDLRDLSSPPTSMTLSQIPVNEVVTQISDAEPDELAPPVTSPRMHSLNFAPHSNRHASERTWYSSLSRWTFSLCFSESCTLFLLVLSETLDVFSPRSVVVSTHTRMRRI